FGDRVVEPGVDDDVPVVVLDEVGQDRYLLGRPADSPPDGSKNVAARSRVPPAAWKAETTDFDDVHPQRSLPASADRLPPAGLDVERVRLGRLLTAWALRPVRLLGRRVLDDGHHPRLHELGRAD